MITYNHEAFIAQAIESVLMQQASFPMELVIGEDCSPDGTRRVVLDYQHHHPDTIRALLWRKNVGGGRNFVHTIAACRGDYIAFCEGDDYWTDPTKLCRQVDLMDSHAEMALCHHTVDYVRWDGNRRTALRQFPPESDRGTRHANDLIGRNFIQTCSLMIRRSCLPELDARFELLKVGDWPLCYLASERGEIGFLDYKMADYRIHGHNAWNALAFGERAFETAQMAFYLAAVAQPSARGAWRSFAAQMSRTAITNQTTSWGAAHRAWLFWRSGSLPTREALWMLITELAKRPVAELRRHRRVVDFLKRVLPLRHDSSR